MLQQANIAESRRKRPPDRGAAIQTADYTAIVQAVEHIRQLEQSTTSRMFAIFIDSLSSIANFSSRRSRGGRPSLFADLMDLGHI